MENETTAVCRQCGLKQSVRLYERINVREAPELKSEVLDGRLFVWECPQCGNRDQSKMNVARRTCGYIGTQYWNQGRTQEIRDRVLHV